MQNYNVGDIVSRKSYGNDIHFTIANKISNERSKPVYVLKGIKYRIEADCDEDDLLVHDTRDVLVNMSRYEANIWRYNFLRNLARSAYNFSRWSRPGKIVHIDSSKEFLDKCLRYYNNARIESVGYWSSENEQSSMVRGLLEKNRPDILVVTGHDGIKKSSSYGDSLENYRNSKYFVQSVKEARKYEPSMDKLCVFAGACQSYFEALMESGANFASSPGRILINALDPAIVSEKVALTDMRSYVTPQQIAQVTITGSKGIGGIKTRGHLTRG